MRGSRPRGDRLVIAVFALIGAAAGLLGFLILNDGPDAAVMTIIAKSSPGSKWEPTFTVVFFGRIAYTRTAPDASTFDAELAFWGRGPFVLTPLLGAIGAGVTGYGVSRGLRGLRRV